VFQQGVANSSASAVSVSNSTAQPVLNVSFDRCVFVPMGSNGLAVVLNKVSTGSADYDANVSITNCLFVAGVTSVRVNGTGNGTYSGGGVRVNNCTFFGGAGACVGTYSSSISTTIPVYVYNSIMIGSTAACISPNTAGQIVEDYNWLGGTATGATSGGHSITNGSYAPLLDFGQWAFWGQYPKPFAAPTSGSPLLGFGNAAGGPSVDFLNRQRPAGGKSLSYGIGYLERHDTAVKETAITDSGVGIRIDGPGSQEFEIPVDAVSTSISVKCQYDSNHGTTTPPQLVLLDCAELGVTGQTVTAAATTDTWLTLSLSPITPTGKGVVRVRVRARPASANGKCYFDTFSVG
jgi:hypothetical protein